MPYQPKNLPYSALEGISANTLQIHHDKLYVGYVNKRNEILEKLEKTDRGTANASFSEFRELKLEETFVTDAQYLHEFYFDVLGGNGEKKQDELMAAIEKDFGSYDKWEEDFRACGMSARGWVVLAFDLNDKKLHNYICDSHNQGGIWGAMPVIVLDVYEHSYYIDHGSDRKSYIDNYFKNLNWQSANEKFVAVQK